MKIIVLTKSLLFASRPRQSQELVFHYQLANCPGKSVIGMKVKFSPGAASPPHRHGGASVAAVVLEGSVFNKMNDHPTTVVEMGGTWYEAPSCHHKICANASETEPAMLFATFVVDTSVINEGGYRALVVVDEEYRDIKLM